MLTQSAESHFGGRAGIAKALAGSRTMSAVYQWGEVVPLGAARRLAALSEGKCQVVEELYDDLGRIIRKPEQHTAA
jgi:hypothetical protein